MPNITADDVRDQSENEEQIENENNQLFENNVWNIRWFSILGIVMAVVVSLIIAQSQVNINHLK